MTITPSLHRELQERLGDLASQTSFLPTALADLTVIGTIYNLGGYLAERQNQSRNLAFVREALPQNSLEDRMIALRATDVFESAKSTATRALATRVAYLGALCLIPANPLAAGAAAIALASFFIAEAGFNSAAPRQAQQLSNAL